jgi:hypothetical protein
MSDPPTTIIDDRSVQASANGAGIRHPLASAGFCSTASYSQTHHSM